MNEPSLKVPSTIGVEDGKCLKTFKCIQCNKYFRYRRHYDKHIEGHEQNNCKYCGELFTVRKELATHLYNLHKIELKAPKLSCQYCDRSFAKKSSLNQHYQLHAKDRHVCLYCGVFFIKFNDYAKHQEKHKYEKPYKCGKCGERFSRRQQYLVHVKGHEKYKCLTCEESFSALYKLTEHRRKGHSIEHVETKYVCEKCKRAFHLQRALVLHQRVHKDEKSYNCLDCEKVFSSRKSYSKHLNSLIHGGRKEKNKTKFGIFICDICGKMCKEKHALSLHVSRVHSREEPIKCSFCNYTSTSKANLKRHMEFHIEDRKFICECCGASFYTLSSLKDHRLYVHSEERNFKCSKCSKSFKRKCGLNRHMLNHSEGRPYECHCGQTYKRMSHLKRHKESSHGIVSQSNNLCRLRCDGSGGFVPVTDDAGKSKKRTSRNSDNSSKMVVMNDDGKELPVISNDSYTAAAELVLPDKQSISGSPVSNMHVELSISSPSTLSEQPDELRSMKEGDALRCLVSENGFLTHRAHRNLPQIDNENIFTNVCLPSSAFSDVPVNNLFKTKSDSIQIYCQRVEGLSHDEVVTHSSQCDLTQLIQGSANGIPIINVVPVDTSGNIVHDETMVLLCLPSVPTTAASDDCQ